MPIANLPISLLIKFYVLPYVFLCAPGFYDFFAYVLPLYVFVCTMGFTSIPFRKKFLYCIGTTGFIAGREAGIEKIRNQRIMSIADYVNPAIVDGWEFDNFKEEN